jgi:hypothetical protein
MRSALLALAMLSSISAFAQSPRDRVALAPSTDRFATPMDGPYATLADLCRAREADPAMCTTPPRDCGAAGLEPLHLGPPFIEARVIHWGGLLARCELLLRTDAGWWQRRYDWEHDWVTSFPHNRGRYISEIDDITSTPEGALVVHGSHIDWRSGDSAGIEHPRFEEWYQCEQRVVVCAVGTSGAPSCTKLFKAGYTTYCRASEPPYRKLRSRVRCRLPLGSACHQRPAHTPERTRQAVATASEIALSVSLDFASRAPAAHCSSHMRPGLPSHSRASRPPRPTRVLVFRKRFTFVGKRMTQHSFFL